MVGHSVVVIGEWFFTDSAFLVLLDNLLVEQLLHFCWGPEFPVSSGVMGIFNALDWNPRSAFFWNLFSAATKERLMNRTEFVATEFHGVTSVWVLLMFGATANNVRGGSNALDTTKREGTARAVRHTGEE